MSDKVIATVQSMEDIGKTQFNGFVEKRMKNPSINFYDNIAKNKLPLFKFKLRKTSVKSQMKITTMKSDVHLFSRMYISCQSRDGDLGTFFQHECHAWPLALAEDINTMRPM